MSNALHRDLARLVERSNAKTDRALRRTLPPAVPSDAAGGLAQ